ncbi:MAG: prepilin-type N-terminal cleavage/methylation domain-containing protein [Candidatus Omnitrophica bacterium]|nr:prepilin-type N-terminal cleavage/methylation domain-containing protein [Candidatus Omnitrophota bacterium]MDD5238000.1 prepilin-type N-terminal cleavage/methylation domain-containing protein [Candidatus Omnitrophota bacterium]
MRKGFTLIELIVVVIVIGILATIAVPQYMRATERAKGGKARHALGVLASAEKMYRADKDTYMPAAAGALNNSTGLGAYVEMADIDTDSTSTTGDWAIATTGAVNGFTATATRRRGPNNNETITLNHNGSWGGTFTP